MPFNETTGPARFPTTRKAQGRLAFLSGHAPSKEAFVSRYWRPIYGYLRGRWGLDRHQIEDATQEFFVFLFDNNVLARPELWCDRDDDGIHNVRHFLKRVAQRFVKDFAERKSNRNWRRRASLEAIRSDHPHLLPANTVGSPEEIFDRQSNADLLLNAARSAARNTVSAERGWVVLAFAARLRDASASYAELGDRLGKPKSTLREAVTQFGHDIHSEARLILRDESAALDADMAAFRDSLPVLSRECCGVLADLLQRMAEPENANEH